MTLRPYQWVMAIVAAAVVAGAAHATFSAGDGAGDLAKPKNQPAPLDDVTRFTTYSKDGHPGHLCEPSQHHAGYVYTRHRYPRVVGGEISAVIHRGYSTRRVPSGTPDEQWIISPPSEAMF